LNTDRVVKQTLWFLKKNLRWKGEIFLAFSGGKDSIVSHHLLTTSKLPFKAYYSFTGIDPPEVVRFIKKNYPDCIFLKPKKTFWQTLSKSIPPNSKIRWCCTTLKKEPSWALPYKHRVLGIRSEESRRRSAYGQINEKPNFTEYYPIYFWKEWLVWDYIEKHNLPYPSLYDEGFDRIGCIICPFHSYGNKHEIYKKRWPKYFDLFEKEIEKLYQKRIQQGATMFYNSSQEFCQEWYKNKNAYWKVPK
jgi:phosphoadenosine phosphosulfate reductase